jgi:hypothetical protein
MIPMKQFLPIAVVCSMVALHSVQAQPANDLFANRITLTGASVSTTGSNAGAGTEAGENTLVCVRMGASVWWRWISPVSGSVTLTTGGSSFDTVLDIFTGTAVSALTSVVCDDNNGPGSTSSATFNAVQNTEYQIRVGGRRFGGGGSAATGTIQLGITTPISVSITSPANGSYFALGLPITINADAISGAGTVTQVVLYGPGGMIGADTASPFSVVWANAPLGTNRLYAVMTDSASQVATSAVVTVFVVNPGVIITSPADNAVYLNTNAITVSAVALVAAGWVTNVEFFVDGQRFGADTTSPFSGVWNNVVPGGHLLTAVGWDNSGASYASAPVGIAVAHTIVATNSVWKYLDNGSDQGTAWVDQSFNDEVWASGPAPLGYGDANNGQAYPATTNSYGPDPNNKFTTTYYRRTFLAGNPGNYTNLLVRAQRDDGVILYLNGTEILRNSMPAETVTYTTFASATIGNADEIAWVSNTVSSVLLLEGTNVLAAEIHQADLTSSDIWLDFEMLGIPVILRNQVPIVSLTDPTNGQSFVAPASITLAAVASDSDGSVTKVEFFADGAKVGESTTGPLYTLEWLSPTVGWHTVQAVATDNQGAAGSSLQAAITVYDAIGTPLVQVSSPISNAVFEGPTNLAITAIATAVSGITNVLFLANDAAITNDTASPYSIVWSNAAFGTNLLTAVAYDATGMTATSAAVRVIVNTPPVNTNPPTIFSVNPAKGAALTNLSSIQVTFSERVFNVEASDLLVNGVPATGLSGSGSNYTFTVTPPGLGGVNITWASGHGITDFGWPSSLPFDETSPSATWSYAIVDLTPPTIVARSPAAGATVTNLTQIAVTFSESVSGVDAADLLVSGTPAIGLGGGGSNYVFDFAQPPSGPVPITWAAGHGIADRAASPNAFNATGAGATWSYTLDLRTILVASNAPWMFLKGWAEASTPVDAWRQAGFDDSSWSNAFAPFFYGDPYSNGVPAFTLLSDMLGGYSSIYLRKTFVVGNAALVTNLLFRAQSDDGFIAWINGVEVLRYNMAAGDLPYNGSAPTAINEPNNTGAAYLDYTLPAPGGYLTSGTNVLAVHAFNNQPTTSSDFGFNAQLYTYLTDPTVVAPRLASVTPSAGTLYSLTAITVKFTEPVGGVEAGDLWVNGIPATGVSGGSSNDVYTFTFPQPAYGAVALTWTASPGIIDFDPVPKLFDGTAAAARWQYTLLNPSAPTVAGKAPPAGATVGGLTQLDVTFSEPVMGVDAQDLLINGAPATGLSGGDTTYTFHFAQPPLGPVSVGWASGHYIQDREDPPNDFDPSRPGSSWTYTLADLTPPAVASQSPPAGEPVTNLTQIVVTFTEPVSGVNAGDLLINGVPAGSLSGSGATYTFSFAQLNATLLNVTWATAHGIRDLAVTPNAFNASAPGSTWFYLTPDNLPPGLASISPPAGATVRSLLQVTVSFSEAVTGVDTNDLLLNSRPARQVSGSGAGPYTFAYAQPSNGPVEVRWSAAHGITDLATPPNPFVGGEWTYLIDPNASFADKVLISEIMFNPLGGRVADEWVELQNVGSDLINLAGWHFTRGLDFTFPNVSLPAGGYLVVAADLAAFRAQYPGVTNVVGGWTGRLANNDETLELATALGEVVNRVHYASEGDWARRERGHGADVVTSLTRNGTTATVTLFGHNFTANDRVLISGADQPQYNGMFVVNSPSSAAFNITVSGTPATPATGRILCRQVIDNGASGWSWFCAADGFGSSLELVNPARPNSVGQNWLSSLTPDGTPGRANSVLSTNVAPFLQEVTHFPPVPRSTDPVTISARVSDAQSNGVQSVTLFYRNHSANYGNNPPAFSSVSMFDDGAHQDGVAQDGLYAATLSAQPNRNVMEFYVQAMGPSGLTRTWPAPTWETNNTLAQLANALYQVDDESSATNMPFLRVVMTETERVQLNGIDTASDAEMNATFLSLDGDGPQVRYGAGIRLRGAGSRSGTPKNFRVNVPTDTPWNNRTRMNLNSRYVHAQLAGSVLAQKAGLPSADARVVQVRINGQNLGSSGISFGCYVLVEPMNGDWAANHFPLDPDGNVYRGSKYPWNANLDYLGTNAATYQGQTGAGYYKTSNRDENDWTDLFNLTYALSPNTADAEYVPAVTANVNVEEWFLYFLVCNFFDYMETSLCRGVGDDYAMYRGLVDKRFRLVAHDFDTILGQGDTAGSTSRPIWVMIDNPATTDTSQRANFLSRFMRHPEFAPIYFRLWQQHLDTTFSPAQLDPLLDQMLGGWVTGNTIPNMKTFAANRRAYVLTQIPTNLTVATTLGTQSGYLYTTSPSAALSGQAHIIDTRGVLVNGSPATWSAWEGRWANTVTLQPGLNQVLVQSLNSNDVEFARATVDIWYDDGSVQNVSGAISSDTTWSASGGPYNVTANLTVNAGVTLTIQPGTTVYLGSGVDLAVANGGTLIATGTPTALIHFTRAPGVTATWGGLTINGGAGSPETRLAYAHFEGNGATAIHSASGTVFLDHLTFGNPAVQYLSLDSSSFVVQDCIFPATTASFEPVHGTSGIKTGGRGLFLRNFFGPITGYNDTIDFTGGHRPGPIVQFINNVFLGSGDDNLDLDNTDAWVEGNIFLHVHKNGSPDTSSAISGGSDTGESSDVTILGNLIYDCDHAAMVKQGGFYTLLNNTIVRQTHQGGLDTEGAVICLADNNMSEGAGMYLEGNIIYDAEQLVRNQTNAIVTFTNNLMPLPWTGPGGGNIPADPLFKHVPAPAATTNFTNWAQAQVMWDWFSLRTGSPATSAGPNSRDLGAVAPTPSSALGTRTSVRGVSISGEPVGATPLTSATLTVGLNRTGSGIPAVGWPNGSGFTHYRWSLDAGAWSGDLPITTPITLAGLSVGPHYVEVVGRNDAGLSQDDAVLGADARITQSRTWVIDPAASPLRLNEVLASNGGAVNHLGTTPDLVELYNASDATQSLAGVRLTDDALDPDKFLFPPGAVIGPRAYLVLYANDPDGTPGYHLGFNLAQEGEAVYLYDAAGNGGALLDSVAFGPQLTDLSIGRLAEGAWALTVPTFGGPNQAAPVGDSTRLRINEWLALGQAPFDADFIELYNTDALPVSLGGLYLSDEILGWRDRQPIAALSFIAGSGYRRFFADGAPGQGPEHLNFGLSGDQGAIGLYGPDLTPIDQVLYQAQRPNVSQGRSPNGGSAIVFFDQPTPGAPNPLLTGPAPFGGALVFNEVLANNASLLEAGRTPDWIELYNGATTNVPLGDLSLTDDTLQPRRFVFAAGTQITPGAYLRVICDPGATNAGPLVNTNFALKSSGGSVYLFDAPATGGSLVSAITYGLQVADLSIGRVPDGSTNWLLCGPTPAAANQPVPSLGSPASLKVNEWMAEAGPNNDDWFELYNPDPQPVALGGLYLTDDLNARAKHPIAPLSYLGTGTNAWQKFVADGNPGAGADHVNFALRAAGEAVGLSDASGALIDGAAFGLQIEGVSEGRFPDGGSDVVKFVGTDSPGASNWRQLPNVVINEALTHTPTNTPLEDAIELRNLTDQPVDVSHWWLSDDPGTLRKYRIPASTLLPPNGFVVIYENQFTNKDLGADIPFALSANGDEIVLSAATNNALTGWRAQVKFGAADVGVSFGRYVTSDSREEFVAMSARTFGVDDPGSVEEFRTGTGAPNAEPRVGPVVLSELMYHPPDLGTNDNPRDEFIELRNITTAPVALFEGTNGWRLRDAVDFDFPAGTVLAPGSYLLVVSFDPTNNPAALAAFRSQYHLDLSVPIVGPWSGKLANDNEDIELRRPGIPDTNGVPSILVERVRYSDTLPWPAEADGTGFSLQRLNEAAFGNDPINWTAAAPTPGPQAAPIDTDGDGLPDPWESLYGLDPFNPADAALDPDFDGLTNLQEYQAGTDPRNGESVLRIQSIQLAANGTNAVLTFTARANRSYSVLWRESLDAGQWTKLADVPAPPVDHAETITDPLPPASGRIYRIVTPQEPGPENPMPAILDSPKPADADVGGNATFHVQAVGASPLNYQWMADTNPIPAVNGPSLTITNVQFADVRAYHVKILDATGEHTSQPVHLATGPRITTQPQSQLAQPGDTVTFSVTAEGMGPLSYRWLRNNRPIAGETSATLVLTNVQPADAGKYTVLVAHPLPWGTLRTRSCSAVLRIGGTP